MGFGIWDRGHSILEVVFGIWDSVFSILDVGFGVLDSEFCILDDISFSVDHRKFGMMLVLMAREESTISLCPI